MSVSNGATLWFYLLSLWIKHKRVTIQMKAIEQYFHVVLFVMLYKVVLTFTPFDETLVCDHSMKAFEQYVQMVLSIML